MIQAEIRAVQVQSVYWIPEGHYVASFSLFFFFLYCPLFLVEAGRLFLAFVYLYCWLLFVFV